jgi:hypothetical protein
MAIIKDEQTGEWVVADDTGRLPAMRLPPSAGKYFGFEAEEPAPPEEPAPLPPSPAAADLPQQAQPGLILAEPEPAPPEPPPQPLQMAVDPMTASPAQLLSLYDQSVGAAPPPAAGMFGVAGPGGDAAAVQQALLPPPAPPPSTGQNMGTREQIADVLGGQVAAATTAGKAAGAPPPDTPVGSVKGLSMVSDSTYVPPPPPPPSTPAAPAAAPAAPQGAAPAGAPSAPPAEGEYNPTTPYQAALYQALFAPTPGGYVAPQEARDRLMGFSQTRQMPVDPALKEAARGVYDMGSELALHGAEVLPEAKKAEAAMYEAAAAEADSEADRIRAQQKHVQALTQRSLAQLEKHTARLAEAADRNVVEEYWDRKGVIGRFAVALSAAGAMMMGGSLNPMMDIAKSEIEGALTQQKARLDSGKASIDTQLSALGQMRAAFQSPEAAENATRSLLYKSLENQTLAAAANTNSEEVRQNYFALAQKYNEERMKWELRTAELEAGSRAESFKHYEAVKGGYYGPKSPSFFEMVRRAKLAGLDPIKDLPLIASGRLSPRLGNMEDGQNWRQRQFEYSVTQDARKRQVVDPFRGRVLYASSDKTKENVEPQLWDMKGYHDDLQSIINYIEKMPAFAIKDLPNTVEGRQLEVMIERLNTRYKGAWLKEALTKSDMEAAPALTGKSLSSWWETRQQAVAGFRTIQGILQRDADSLVKNRLYTSPNADPKSLVRFAEEPPAGSTKEHD